jgi:hypothetical protein
MLPLVSAGPFALEPIPGVGGLLFIRRISLEELWGRSTDPIDEKEKK